MTVKEHWIQRLAGIERRFARCDPVERAYLYIEWRVLTYLVKIYGDRAETVELSKYGRPGSATGSPVHFHGKPRRPRTGGEIRALLERRIVDGPSRSLFSVLLPALRRVCWRRDLLVLAYETGTLALFAYILHLLL
jgi:hypothetical protein